MKKKDLKCLKSEEFSERKVEILYIAHPDDFDLYLEPISKGISSIIASRFYYGEPGFVPTEGELKKAHIDFVVMPVGKGLLKDDSEESKLYKELVRKQYLEDKKNVVHILPIYTVENTDLEKLPELSSLLYHQLRFTEIRKAYASADETERKDMISFLTAFGYVKALGLEDRFLKFISYESLMKLAERYDEKYKKLWTMQPLGIVSGSYGRGYDLWASSGSFFDKIEKCCLKDIELSREFAEKAGTDEGYNEVFPAYDYMIDFYVNHGKYKKAKGLAEESLEYRQKLIDEKDFGPAKTSLTLAYYYLGRNRV